MRIFADYLANSDKSRHTSPLPQPNLHAIFLSWGGMWPPHVIDS